MVSDATASFDSFNKILKKEMNGSEDMQKTMDPRLDQAGGSSTTVEVTLDPSLLVQVPQDTTAVKILEAKATAGAVVQIHHDPASGHFYLHSNSDVSLAKGLKLASVGSGRVIEGGDGKIKVNFQDLGDRTLMECVMGGTAEGTEDKAPMKGSAYTVLKAVQKQNSCAEVVMTGHKAKLHQSGFTIESTGPLWGFQPSPEKPDKADKGVKITCQNIATRIAALSVQNIGMWLNFISSLALA